MLKNFFANFGSNPKEFEELLLAPNFNENQVAKVFSSNNIDINRIDNHGDTFLDICLENNKFKAASWLINQGITVTNKNKKNISSVRLAIEKGDIQVIDNIMKRDEFDINQVDKLGRSLLQDAVILGQKEISKKLIRSDIDLNITDKNNRTVIYDAVAYGDEDIINEILKSGDLELNNVDSTGKTILHTQAVLENDTLAKKLIEKGADPTIADPEGMNFITKTALRGHDGEEVLDTIIDKGFNLNAKVAEKSSVLLEVLYAFIKVTDGEMKRREELKSVAKKLIINGSDINAVNKKGETVLFNTVKIGDIEGTVFLLENGININKQNYEQESVLQIASLKGIQNLDLVILLLHYGADPTLKNKYGQTLLEVLNNVIIHVHGHRLPLQKDILNSIDSDGKYMIILKEILNIKSFDYDYLDTKGNPLFFMPLLYNELKTTKLYIQSGLNLNAKNINGHSLFYEYVLKCFEKGIYFKEFRENLVFLLVSGSDIDAKNKEGQTIFTKVASIQNCNLKLFRKLIEVTRYDYSSIDKQGRTIIHSCVMSDNMELLNIVYGVERKIQDISDNYNLLPITYAALKGNSEMVNEFLRRDALITSGKPIPQNIKEKFHPMLENLEKLTDQVFDPDLKRKFEILKEQTRRDFAL